MQNEFNLTPQISSPKPIGDHIAGDETLVVSSRKIAELCEKQHKNVKRDIETMLSDIGIGNALKFERIYFDTRNREQTEYCLPKDLALTLVAGYDAKLRYRLIKYIEELEGLRAQRPQTVDLNDPGMLRGLLANYAERTEVAEAALENARPKIEAYDRLDACEGALGLRIAAKTLGYPERKLTRWLEVNGWAYRQNGRGSLQAYAQRRKDGFLDHKPNPYIDPISGEHKIGSSLVITPKGLARLAKVLPKEGFLTR